MMKRIILCADDYGQNPAISQAIIDLLEKKRLSATSCLTTSNHWLEYASRLEPFKNQADIGLHFNLTEDTPFAEPLSQLIIKSNLRLLNKKAIVAECHAQLDLFQQGMGRLPDFVDGHQHVHQFPVIREALLDVYEERLRKNNSYIRCTYNPGSLFNLKTIGYVKQLIIELCGARAFKKTLLARKIPHNHSFSGIYDFNLAAQYSTFFPEFINQIQDGGLIMCHPGLENQSNFNSVSLANNFEHATPRSSSSPNSFQHVIHDSISSAKNFLHTTPDSSFPANNFQYATPDSISQARKLEYDYLSYHFPYNVQLIRFQRTFS